MHNTLVLSFRKDMIIVQTMTNPYRMSNIDTKGLYTTMIPLSSMKNYEFECNVDQVNVMVGKNILIGNFKSKCINVVRTEPLGIDSKYVVEVTFDGLVKERNSAAYVLSSGSFGRHVKDSYPHFLINSTIDCVIQEDDVRKLSDLMEIQSV